MFLVIQGRCIQLHACISASTGDIRMLECRLLQYWDAVSERAQEVCLKRCLVLYLNGCRTYGFMCIIVCICMSLIYMALEN
jgi:hypothetical protein